eukprot:9936020-Ditylum_brightwellii.AAC.1
MPIKRSSSKDVFTLVDSSMPDSKQTEKMVSPSATPSLVPKILLTVSPLHVDIMKSMDSSQLCHQESSASIKVVQPYIIADKLKSITEETLQLALPAVTLIMTPKSPPIVVLESAYPPGMPCL